MEEIKKYLSGKGYPAGDLHDLPPSKKRFADGAEYRFEIPTVEGPNVLEAVLEEAEKYKVTVQRVSQGSGIMLLTDSEIEQMVNIGRDAKIEVSLFVGPRAPWDIAAHPFTEAGKTMGWRVAGMDQLIYALEDIKRACSLGLRGVLVGDEGVLFMANEMKKDGLLPNDLVIKASAMMAHPNPVSIKMCQDLGANTYNILTDQTFPRLAAMRSLVDIPVDMYIEVPDNLGGYIRFFDAPQIIKVAAPVYFKFGLKNVSNAYPSGTHMEASVIAAARERVRRAKILSDMIEKYHPEAITSDVGASDLGIPV